MSEPKIGLIDIETAPIGASVWGLFDQNVGLNQIHQEWSILSFCYKRLGAPRKELIYLDTSKEKDVRNDSAIVAKLWEIMDADDFLIAQNGKRFDLRKIRARMLMHGMPPPAPVKVIDTMLMAREVAAFTSNKLEWLSTYLSRVKKSSHRQFPGFELWSECLAGNQKAWDAMRRYNIPDVLAMEEVYLRLRPWVANHPNVAAHVDDEEPRCPRCGSTEVTRRGYAYTNVGKYPRYHCNSCLGWSRGRYSEASLGKRKATLASI